MNIFSKTAAAAIMLIAFAATTKAQDSAMEFVKLQREFENTALAYRMAKTTNDNNTPARLVIYLHGGSSCGSDNETQMQEPGIDSIARYLAANDTPSVFLVPQCPDRTKGWGGMAKVVKSLLDFTVRTQSIDTARIYIFGGSMGGTGTWKMLSTYPNYFAAAMPCAANPSGMNAENAATTPVYNVMGLADNIMNENVRKTAEDFISQLLEFGDEAVYETVEGWTHENTCIMSYTTKRLDWVFSHNRAQTNGIHNIIGIGEPQQDVWFTIEGVKITAPTAKGIYIHNGKKVLVR